MSFVRHITLPKGFVAGATACGIKPSGKKDLAIIAGRAEVSAAVVTTSNQITGAPIQWIRHILPRGCGKVRGMVINAGNSNVCTGKTGLKDTETMAGLTAKILDAEAQEVLVASTGIIGHPLPMAKVKKGIAAAGATLSLRNDGDVAEAILTTDLRAKSAFVQTRIASREVRLGGIVKGSGMIAPSMATMIAVITTDAKIAPTVLRKALRQAVAGTFNAITVDSDQSTSDVVAVLASGLAGNKTIQPGTAAYRKFAAALAEVCGELARSVVADGEGATRLVEVIVRGARTDAEAEVAAKSVANSPLVKTAVHGADPNWGRIAMALGKSAAKVVAEKLTIRIGGQPPSRRQNAEDEFVKVFARGMGCKFSAKKASSLMAGDTVKIDCNLGLGQGKFTALTCDLSREYIAINADYTT
ncbi:MAG: bifunctional glutamate N-acetyltransferase/amino-acid acetyltransferase ArgJ [Phycisphaerae bacterium]|nr:bifunctional glutamate N-acetyltransferase/amino-acid acetyltransferase ArgJ [Phycisphaerae bacterium]